MKRDLRHENKIEGQGLRGPLFEDEGQRGERSGGEGHGEGGGRHSGHLALFGRPFKAAGPTNVSQGYQEDEESYRGAQGLSDHRGASGGVEKIDGGVAQVEQGAQLQKMSAQILA
jgi:hypothetical protein